ncbi:lysozyme [Shewanella sp. phage 1/4]|uniref:endolysin n=1 Tax=Shewanella phage 1/4 TaxID=1458859 RepID=UPI0004F81CC8|nr:endolysin [Shewanella sp. phage 1/4]AHK11139.1 lysozyme [Shewanella sp. phage 1/4]
MLNSYNNSPQFVKTFIETTIKHEGGDKYTDDKNDSGGKTRYGVTEKATLKYKDYFHLYQWDGNMKTLPLAFAQDLYAHEYFMVPKFNLVAEVSQMVAQELFDTSVNVGTSRPSKWLQEELNLCNRREVDYKDIIADGKIGSKTISALEAFLGKRGSSGEVMLYNNLNCCQHQHYRQCALNEGANDKDENFYVGWCENRLNFKYVEEI